MKTQFPPQLQENESQPGTGWRKGHFRCRLSWLPVLLILFTALPGLAAAPARDAVPPAPAAISLGGELPLLWDNQCVDCPKTISRIAERSLRLDAQGRPHIAYGGDHLYYAWFDGSAWIRQTVDPSPGVGLFTSLALDGNGNPHISYCKALERLPSTVCDDLRYARWNGRVWQIQTVDSGWRAGNSSSITLDQAGHPHIAYISNPTSTTGSQLQYAHWTGSVWEIETVVTGTVIGISRTCSLALDGEGNPWISYYDSAEFALKVARGVEGVWTTETVDGAVFSNLFEPRDLDGSNAAHIAYTTTSGELKYAHWMEGAWDVQTVDSTHESAATSASLALDADGNPHISYYDSYHHNLKHIYWSGSQWFFEAFAGNSGYIWDVSLALGPDGAPHIVYFALHSLQYLVRQGRTWVDQTVDRDETVGSPLSFRLDPSGNAHLVYAGVIYSPEFNWSLKYARQSGNTWDFQTIEEAAYPGGLNSLALDQNGYPHISYYNDNELDLKYAYWDGSQWQVQVVDKVGYEGSSSIASSSIAIDRAGRPHISYYNDTSRTINYTHWTGSAWEIQTVDSALFSGGVSSLVLDGSGAPHIAYTAEDFYLKYARWTGSDWEIQTIDTGGGPSSLVLDAAGLPHLVYVPFGIINLTYTHWTGSVWETEVVDERTISSASLALDEQGRPHISYSTYNPYYPYYTEVMYTHWNGAAWEFRTVDSRADAASSLALDGDGSPHVCYVDDTLGDLRCAVGIPAASVISLPLVSLAR